MAPESFPHLYGTSAGLFGVLMAASGSATALALAHFGHASRSGTLGALAAVTLFTSSPHLREHSGNVREHSGNIRERSGNIQGTFREHSGNIRERSGNIQGTFRERSGNVQGKVREKSRD
eukprot:9905-Prorocentrum_minimum.AAC.3